MNAEPLLKKLAKALHDCKLEAIMVGNAAAALQGAPVTTVDVDFVFRKTETNLDKLKRMARMLDARLSRPHDPVSEMFRLECDSEGWQVDFLVSVIGIRTFEGLRARSDRIMMGKHELLVADLRDILKSKKAAGRPKDRAVLHVLEATLREKQKHQ